VGSAYLLPIIAKEAKEKMSLVLASKGNHTTNNDPCKQVSAKVPRLYISLLQTQAQDSWRGLETNGFDWTQVFKRGGEGKRVRAIILAAAWICIMGDC
jgi:hypothetical protein